MDDITLLGDLLTQMSDSSSHALSALNLISQAQQELEKFSRCQDAMLKDIRDYLRQRREAGN